MKRVVLALEPVLHLARGTLPRPAHLDRHVEHERDVRHQTAGGEPDGTRHVFGRQSTPRDLIRDGREVESVCHHYLSRFERRTDHPLDQVGPGREKQEQLRDRRHLVGKLERHLARRLRHGGAARLPHRHYLESLGDEPRREPTHQRGLPRPFRALHDDEDAHQPKVMMGLAAPCFIPS